MCKPRLIFIILVINFLFNCLILTAAKADDVEILYLFASGEQSVIPEHVELAADALGLSIKSVFCEKVLDQSFLKKKAGVVVSPEVALEKPECFRMLLKNLPKATPLLLTGLRSIHQKPLRELGFPIAIEASTFFDLNPHKVIVHPVPLVSFFGGLQLDCRSTDSFRLYLPDSQPIIGYPDSNEAAHYLVTKAEKGREFFFLAGTRFSLVKPLLDADDLLLRALPYLIFFSRVGGDRLWQGSALFANLTIDDPFLVEPYGRLSFEKLVHEMDAHRFHATISFIPRNFDRNEQNTVSLFRSRPDRFSIAVHGNNHDRREFYRYSSKDWIEPFSMKTRQEHERNLFQALVRMDEFSRLTGIPYDPVMIFPQEIAPAHTLRLCKQLGYIATINGSNVPLDSVLPRRIKMSFRPFNFSFYSFLNLRRVKVEYYSELQIRADLFMGNPLFLYAHHNLFEPGIERFNSVADLINSLSSKIEWASLGKIISHWFLWRRTAHNVFEVKMLAPVCIVMNEGKATKHYKISKEEDDVKDIQSITVNGETIPWKRETDRLEFSLDLLPGESGEIVIHYKSADASRVVVGLYDGNSIMIALWRGLAEFRDRILSRSTIGIVIRDFLYKSGISTWIPLSFLSVIAIAIAGIVLLRFRRGSSKRKKVC